MAWKGGKTIAWEWQDDNNIWKQYSSKVSSFIETNKSASWNDNMMLGRVDKSLSSYILDIPSMEQMNRHTDNVRAIRRRVYTDDGDEDDSSDSDSGVIVPFNRMGLGGSSSLAGCVARRSPCDEESDNSDESDEDFSDQSVQWQYFAAGRWVNYESDVMRKLEAKHQLGEQMVYVSIHCTPYEIDVIKMRQTNQTTRTDRKIRRVAGSTLPKYTTPGLRTGLLPLSHEEEDFIKRLSTHTWIHKDNMGTDAKNLVWDGIRITRIEKVQNSNLWARYENRKNSISNVQLPDLEFDIRTTNLRRNHHDIMGIDKKKEMLLFHGTKIENIDNIKQKGILINLSKTGLYGNNIYLSDCCQKADQYSDDKDNRRDQKLAMILCRVLLGKVGLYQGVSAISGFDSAIGGTAKDDWRRFYEFMIWDETQIYPAFVIHYNRT